MAEPPELWTFTAANLVMFGFGATLTTLSYYAYRSTGRATTYLISTLGFATITIGGLAEPVYQLGLKGDYHLSGRELLALQTAEALLTAVGLGLLFYSIYAYGRGGQASPVERVESSTEPP